MAKHAQHKKRMGKPAKVILWILATLVAIAAAALIFINVYIGKSKAVIEGNVQLSVLDDNVTVTRDENGVPHLDAKSDADLYRAQGYVHAQDRLFQMDLARRQASGRLSEVVGAKAIDTDKQFRTFSLRNAAEKSFDTYSDDAKQVLEWYTDGVNEFIEEVKDNGKLSYEFKLLGYEPEPWTPIDSLTIGKYMAYDLGGKWTPQAMRHWALNEYSEEKAQELFITYPENAESIMEANKKNPVQVTGQFDPGLLPYEFNGSNNWVVSGDKTKSGMPLLADDPHLGLSTPSIWHQIHLKSPEQNVSGVIFAGIPGIILGHNEKVAWGVTNVGPDVQDLYIEIPNPDDPTQFQYDDEWEQAEVRDETIRVKDEEDVPFEVIVTRHGPIITDVIYKDEKPDAVFSMQWTALEPSNELEAIMDLNKADDWESFETALEAFSAPAQNFVFASTDGTIAFKANGKIPIRKKGDAQLPVPGNSSEYGWDGYVPYDELPTVVNPEEGFIATANNEVVDEKYPYHITKFWAQPYRYERIAEVLREGDDFTADDMMDLQMDQKNLHAGEFLDSLIGSIEKMDRKGSYKEILAQLKDWDQVDSVDAPQPLVFHKLMKQLPVAMFASDMPADVYEFMPGKPQLTDQFLRNAYNGDPSTWVEEYGGVDQWVFDAFEKTMASLKEDYGDNYEKWQWGDFHQLVFPHPLSSASPVLARFLDPEKQPVGGSGITVQAASFKDDGSANHGASWRFVADLDDLSKAYHIVGPGQSGHVKSQWFHDQADDWLRGDFHETVLEGDVKDGHVLTLEAK
ncbi:penicillin acylase family protein [Sporosarcina gallistercoris]|uniref:Penicillin acylase family protein n=1 Tax=Sporosarcina gallistercoris TaxID=2762245 RepID=A0ABR8PGV0_9BACL|nr:penicillin acylase family protein [Sporosarcina gallistercoris]MBD7907394.1 penicillin acylase family protein [Sporosarcina gallistercoris]